MNFKNITAKTNRGVLLDIVVFVLNLLMMRWLTSDFIELLMRSGEDDVFAKWVLAVCFLAAFILPAAGAVLKRWHFHWRIDERQKRRPKMKKRRFDPLDLPSSGAAGCLFNPIFYFSLQLVIASVVMTFLSELLVGKNFQQRGAVFVPFVLLSFVLCIVQTFLVYRYFSRPKKTPKGAFWRDPRSELLGDVCIYLNMILFQLFWNVIIGQVPFGRVESFVDLAGRLFFLCFVALLIYFPPRIFYLAEDIHRRSTWLTMLLANSPTILRVLFGQNMNVQG